MKTLVDATQFRDQTLPSTEFDSLGFGVHLLRFAAKGLFFTDIGKRLSFSIRFVNFVRFIGLFLLNRTELLEPLKNPASTRGLCRFDATMLRSYLDMMYKSGLVRKQDTTFVVKPQYSYPLRLPFDEFINAVRARDWRTVLRLFPDDNPYKQIAADFLFVFTMTCIRYGVEVDTQETAQFGVTRRWRRIAQCDLLFYEITKSGTVLDLLRADLIGKIPATDDDEFFFTNLGRMAFNSFTEPNFRRTIELIFKQRDIKTAMDIGCGFGDYVGILREFAHIKKIYGVERQEAAYRHVQARFEHDSTVQILGEDVLDIRLDGRVDAIFLVFVLFYFSKEGKRKLFARLAELLSENGVIVLGQYYPHVERIRQQIAVEQGEYSWLKKIDMYFATKLQYAEVLLNETVAAFGRAERWNELCDVLEDVELEIASVTNADMYYYAFFVVIQRKREHRVPSLANTKDEADTRERLVADA